MTSFGLTPLDYRPIVDLLCSPAALAAARPTRCSASRSAGPVLLLSSCARGSIDARCPAVLGVSRPLNVSPLAYILTAPFRALAARSDCSCLSHAFDGRPLSGFGRGPRPLCVSTCIVCLRIRLSCLRCSHAISPAWAEWPNESIGRLNQLTSCLYPLAFMDPVADDGRDDEARVIPRRDGFERPRIPGILERIQESASAYHFIRAASSDPIIYDRGFPHRGHRRRPLA